MTGASPRIAVVGAGIGGLAAAIASEQHGCRVTVYEQAAQFGRVGAGINLTPNAVRVLDALGVGAALRRTAATPTFRVSRRWDTGEETSRLALGASAQATYGSTQLTLHRADLLAALESRVPQTAVRFGKRLRALERSSGELVLQFADGTHASADAVVGCDGIHTAAGEALFGAEEPIFAGMSAYRAIVPSSALREYECAAFVKWWGPDPRTQLVTMPLGPDSVFVFATLPEASWVHESWSMQGDVAELQRHYAGFHAHARAVVQAVSSVLRTALYSRAPRSAWSAGNATLLGDAAHPMMPFMAQGAAMALEDAVVLGACLGRVARGEVTVAAAFTRYEELRLPRASRIQTVSGDNDWLRTGNDAGWVYGYDATAEAV